MAILLLRVALASQWRPSGGHSLPLSTPSRVRSNGRKMCRTVRDCTFPGHFMLYGVYASKQICTKQPLTQNLFSQRDFSHAMGNTREPNSKLIRVIITKLILSFLTQIESIPSKNVKTTFLSIYIIKICLYSLFF